MQYIEFFDITITGDSPLENKVTIETGDVLKAEIASAVRMARNHYAALAYADVRVNIVEMKSAGAENGILKGSGYDYGLELHVRAIARAGRMAAPGYFGISLGPTDLPNFFGIVSGAIETSYRRARFNATHKLSRSTEWGELGASLWSTELAPIPAIVDTMPAVFRQWPLDIPVADVGEAARWTSAIVKEVDERIKMNYIGLATWVERELFCSTEGSVIDQTFCYTQGLVYVVAVSNGVQQAHYDYLGHQR